MLNTAEQIPFDLGHRTALGRADFLVSPSNQDAVAWLDLWPDWPAPALILYGPVASGKSHLGAVWCEQSHACCVNPKDLSPQNVAEIALTCDHLIFDDADGVIGNLEQEKGLFHLYNIFKEERRSFLLVLKEPPIRRTFALPDLASRLRAAPAVSIREPDDHLLAALLVKLFGDRQLKVGTEVIHYIIPRIERSFEAAQNLVIATDRRALIHQRAISVPLIRDVLTQMEE